MKERKKKRKKVQVNYTNQRRNLLYHKMINNGNKERKKKETKKERKKETNKQTNKQTKVYCMN